MAIPWFRWLKWTAIAGAICAALVLPWALPWLRRWLPTQWDTWIVVAIAVDAVLVLLAAIWWLWWRLPRRQVRSLDIQIHEPKARADVEDNFRKTVGQALGGLAVLIGVAAAYLQFSQQQQAAHDQLQAATDLRISNQVAKGFEQLASDKPTMRLGGIYGLEGVMNAPSDYHQPVLEALCAFVRDGTIGMIVGEHPTTDIQAALTVIGRREAGEGDRVDLSAARIAGANLRGANLHVADLTDANLRGANLRDANLTGANLTGANLGGANLTGASLTGANLAGAKLSGANLTGANLMRFILTDADMSGANLSSADLSLAALQDANLTYANLSSADLRNANLSDTNLSGADLSGAQVYQRTLDTAFGDDETKLPVGLTIRTRKDATWAN